MHDALYAAASGMTVVSRALDVAAQNAANANSPGYLSRVLSSETFHSALERAEGRRGTLVDGRESIGFEAGVMIPGSESFTVGIRGPGFLTVQSATGPLYTRNGDFRIGSDGTFRTAGDLPILSRGALVTVDPLGVTPRIDSAGRVFQGDAEVGRIELVEFASPDLLERRGDYLVAAPPEAGLRASTTSELAPGMVEIPQSRGMSAVVAMISASRAFEASQRVIRTVAESTSQLLRNRI